MGEMLLFNLCVFKTLTNGFLSVSNDSLNKVIWKSLKIHPAWIIVNLRVHRKLVQLQFITSEEDLFGFFLFRKVTSHAKVPSADVT